MRAASELELASWVDLTLIGTGRYDGYHPANMLDRDAGDSHRWTGAGTAELRLHGALGSVRFELRPSVRLEHSETRASGLRFGQPQRYRTSRTAPTVRVGAAVAPTWWLSLVSSVATGTRFPSILELFGNRGTLQPNPELVPETGRSLDVGVVVRNHHEGLIRGTAELRLFHLAIDELIVYRPTSQYTWSAENRDQGRSWGIEAGVRGSVGPHVELTGALTWMRTDDGRGNALNWRPELQGQVRPEVHTRRLGFVEDVALFVALVHRSRVFSRPRQPDAPPGPQLVEYRCALCAARRVLSAFRRPRSSESGRPGLPHLPSTRPSLRSDAAIPTGAELMMKTLAKPFPLGLGLLLGAATGCGSEAAPRELALEPLETEPAFAVVSTDFASTSIGVLDAVGNVQRASWYNSGSTSPGLTAALGGDVVLPTTQADDGTFAVIDRLGTDVVTRVRYDGTLVGQIRLNPTAHIDRVQCQSAGLCCRGCDARMGKPL